MHQERNSFPGWMFYKDACIIIIAISVRAGMFRNIEKCLCRWQKAEVGSSWLGNNTFPLCEPLTSLFLFFLLFVFSLSSVPLSPLRSRPQHLLEEARAMRTSTCKQVNWGRVCVCVCISYPWFNCRFFVWNRRIFAWFILLCFSKVCIGIFSPTLPNANITTVVS